MIPCHCVTRKLKQRRTVKDRERQRETERDICMQLRGSPRGLILIDAVSESTHTATTTTVCTYTGTCAVHKRLADLKNSTCQKLSNFSALLNFPYRFTPAIRTSEIKTIALKYS